MGVRKELNRWNPEGGTKKASIWVISTQVIPDVMPGVLSGVDRHIQITLSGEILLPFEWPLLGGSVASENTVGNSSTSSDGDIFWVKLTV